MYQYSREQGTTRHPCSVQELMGRLEQLEVAMTERKREVCTCVSVAGVRIVETSTSPPQEEKMVVMEKKKRCVNCQTY